MEMSENDKFGIEKAADDQSSSPPIDWQLGAMNLVCGKNTSLAVNPVIPMSASQCPSVTMALNAGLWSRAYEVPSFTFAQSNVPITANSMNSLPMGKPVAVPCSGMFLTNVPGVLQSSIFHCPADSALIEQAARFSCFGGDRLSGMISNTSGPSSLMAPYSNVTKDAFGTQLQHTDFSMTEAKGVSSPVDGGSNTSSSPVVNPKISTLEASYTEVSQEANTSSADAAGDSSPSSIGAKKRRINQDVEMYQVEQGSHSFLGTTADNAETKLKRGSNRTKIGGKNAKDSPEAPKEEYVHVRARRGQATNSHSLAERVRREKISERMKYLQDLVPGCSKVTGKAVMLDEIINYVQSLQRQVEFLSMKLAAVNPRLDYNLEALLAKDIFHSRSPPLSMYGFSRETMHPFLHLQQQGFFHPGASGIVNLSDSVGAMNTQLANMTGYKDPSLQIQNAWDQDLQNVMQVSYNANLPPDAQE